MIDLVDRLRHADKLKLPWLALEYAREAADEIENLREIIRMNLPDYKRVIVASVDGV